MTHTSIAVLDGSRRPADPAIDFALQVLGPERCSLEPTRNRHTHLPLVEEVNVRGMAFRIERGPGGDEPVRYYIDGRRVGAISWYGQRYEG